ncbi:hypothetical protein GCM10027436_50550 [Actinophytocola sediminis]
MFTSFVAVPPGDSAQAVPLAMAHGMQQVAWQAEGHALEQLAVYAANADEEFAALEVAALLGMSFRAAQRRLDLAITLATRLPLTLEAVKQGRIDSYRASRIADAVAHLSDQDASIVEAEVVAQAENLAPAPLNRLLGRVIHRIDAATIQRRHEQRVAERRVDAYPTEDGCAAFTVHGPADRVHLADLRVNAIAHRLQETGAAGDRTLDQLRADVALDLLAGRGFKHARVTVQLTLSVATALGVGTAPAQLAGYGDLPAQRALVLAGQKDATWRRILTDQKTGQAVDVGRRRYTPPTALRDQVRAELPTCTAPGCIRPAYECDLDHRQPFPDGPTNRDNLHPACRRHHRAKTHGGWEVLDQDRTLVWVSPAGYRYAHRPEPIADPDPPPNTGAGHRETSVIASLAVGPWRLAEGPAEAVDEGAGRGPAAAMGDRGDRMVVGQQQQCVVQAQLGAPLGKGHAEVSAEQPAQGAFARADLAAELAECAAVGDIVPQQLTHRAHARVGRCGELTGQLTRRPQLIEQHRAQSAALDTVIVQVLRAREDQLAQQRADVEHRGRGQPQRVGRGGQAEQVEFQRAMSVVSVHASGRHPDRAVARGDPCPVVRGHGQHARSGVDDLVVVMAMGGDPLTGGQRPGAGGRSGQVADF